jgi:hypothetical protein
MSDYGISSAKEMQAGSVMEAGIVARESQRIQAQVVMAKKFPRDENRAIENIKKSCGRLSLAEMAEYSFPRGGETVKGPSIRLAEAIAQAWGNMDFGIRELEQTSGSSTMEAYAWDVENNVYRSQTFEAPHVRDTRGGRKAVTDARDVYEVTANMGARRMRACILQLIPGDVIDMAVDACRETVKKSLGGDDKKLPAERRKIVNAFVKYKVTQKQLEDYCGKPIDQWDADVLLDLTTIGTSLRDGISKPADHFPDAAQDQRISIAQVDELARAIKGKEDAGMKIILDAGFSTFNEVTVAELPKLLEAIKALK